MPAPHGSSPPWGRTVYDSFEKGVVAVSPPSPLAVLKSSPTRCGTAGTLSVFRGFQPLSRLHEFPQLSIYGVYIRIYKFINNT